MAAEGYFGTFRMYQLNLDGQGDRVYQKYWNLYDKYILHVRLLHQGEGRALSFMVAALIGIPPSS